MKKIALFFLLLLAAGSVSATEIIIINQTKEKVFSIEDVLISGDLNVNSLSITGSGEVISGDSVKVYLFGPASDVLVKNLMVNNQKKTVSFDKDGYFFMADEGAFSFSGVLDIRTIGQVRLFVNGPMNQLRFDLQHGYAIDGDQYGLLDKEVIIQRAEEISMTVDGNFRFTYAEKNEFLYQINFRAYGGSLGAYTIDLKNNEIVTDVIGAVKWEQTGNKLVLDLKSRQASVTIRGLFNSNALRIPLEKDRHHVLIESDPEKKIAITTSAKELDVSESPIGPQYPNGRVFLASKDDVFQITVKKLEVMPSLGAAVDYATNTVAITTKGSVVGEMIYRYKNTGVDYLEVDTPGRPLYVSTERSAMKLTKEDKLVLAFPKTKGGTFDLVYFTTVNRLWPINYINIPLAKTDLPITEATTTIFLPEDYYVLETFGAKGGSELPTAESAILYVILIGGLSALLLTKRKFVLSYILFSFGLLVFNPVMFLLLIAVTIILIAKRYLSGKSMKAAIAGVAVLMAVGICVLILFVFIWQLGVFSMGAASSRTLGYGADYALVEEAAPAPAIKGLELIGQEDKGAITVPVRQGVYPVKLEIPRLGKTITVRNNLVTKENQISLSVLLIASWFKYLLYLISLYTGIICYKMYRANPASSS